MKSLDRRDLLHVGCSTLFGLTLPRIMSAATNASNGAKPKSVILVLQSGGCPQMDSFDPKPDGPSETKGEFGAIQTKTPGMLFSDQLPHLAKVSDKFAIVRTMAHRDNRHLSATHHALTGAAQVFRGNANEDKELSRLDRPSYGSALEYLRPSVNGLPSQVTAPLPLIEGPLTWPGQHSGFLGPKFDPWIINSDPSTDEFKVDGVQLIDGMTTSRLKNRKGLLEDLNSQKRSLDRLARKQQFTSQQDVAFNLLTSGKLTGACDIHAESDELRDRYGRNKYGQTLLLARRMVENGVPFVQANMGHVQSWDTHAENFPRLKGHLLPGVDQGVSALITDLEERGLIDDVLIVVVGEFGRSPRISTLPNATVPGRDHWAYVYSALFAGGGVRGGQVIGKSDHQGGYPTTTPYSPDDMGATIYNTLGINPHAEIIDHQDRPMRLSEGNVMDVLYTG